MDLDDPTKPEFASWKSYRKFARSVRDSRRDILKNEVQAFLGTVIKTLKDRDCNIPNGTIFYRAQEGIKYGSYEDEDGNILPTLYAFCEKRMKPIKDRSKEGRVNPAGIPVLYLASTEQTAISEVRPWIRTELSLARCKITRDLKAVDLSLGYGELSILNLTLKELGGEDAPDAQKKEKAVWIEIDNAFSRPVTLSDDAAGYAPTQILAELFRDAGYDAIVYRSQFGEMGYNIALFNVDDAEVITAVPCHVTSIDIKFDEIGNSWYSTRDSELEQKKSD